MSDMMKQDAQQLQQLQRPSSKAIPLHPTVRPPLKLSKMAQARQNYWRSLLVAIVVPLVLLGAASVRQSSGPGGSGGLLTFLFGGGASSSQSRTKAGAAERLKKAAAKKNAKKDEKTPRFDGTTASYAKGFYVPQSEQEFLDFVLSKRRSLHNHHGVIAATVIEGCPYCTRLVSQLDSYLERHGHEPGRAEIGSVRVGKNLTNEELMKRTVIGKRNANPIVLLDAKIFSKPFLDQYNVPSAYPSVSLWFSAASEHTTERIPSVLWYEYHEQAYPPIFRHVGSRILDWYENIHSRRLARLLGKAMARSSSATSITSPGANAEAETKMNEKIENENEDANALNQVQTSDPKQKNEEDPLVRDLDDALFEMLRYETLIEKTNQVHSLMKKHQELLQAPEQAEAEQLEAQYQQLKAAESQVPDGELTREELQARNAQKKKLTDRVKELDKSTQRKLTSSNFLALATSKLQALREAAEATRAWDDAYDAHLEAANNTLKERAARVIVVDEDEDEKAAPDLDALYPELTTAAYSSFFEQSIRPHPERNTIMRSIQSLSLRGKAELLEQKMRKKMLPQFTGHRDTTPVWLNPAGNAKIVLALSPKMADLAQKLYFDDLAEGSAKIALGKSREKNSSSSDNFNWGKVPLAVRLLHEFDESASVERTREALKTDAELDNMDEEGQGTGGQEAAGAGGGEVLKMKISNAGASLVHSAVRYLTVDGGFRMRQHPETSELQSEENLAALDEAFSQAEAWQDDFTSTDYSSAEIRNAVVEEWCAGKWNNKSETSKLWKEVTSGAYAGDPVGQIEASVTNADAEEGENSNWDRKDIPGMWDDFDECGNFTVHRIVLHADGTQMPNSEIWKRSFPTAAHAEAFLQSSHLSGLFHPGYGKLNLEAFRHHSRASHLLLISNFKVEDPVILQVLERLQVKMDYLLQVVWTEPADTGPIPKTNTRADMLGFLPEQDVKVRLAQLKLLNDISEKQKEQKEKQKQRQMKKRKMKEGGDDGEKNLEDEEEAAAEIEVDTAHLYEHLELALWHPLGIAMAGADASLPKYQGPFNDTEHIIKWIEVELNRMLTPTRGGREKEEANASGGGGNETDASPKQVEVLQVEAGTAADAAPPAGESTPMEPTAVLSTSSSSAEKPTAAT